VSLEGFRFRKSKNVHRYTNKRDEKRNMGSHGERGFLIWFKGPQKGQNGWLATQYEKFNGKKKEGVECKAHGGGGSVTETNKERETKNTTRK